MEARAVLKLESAFDCQFHDDYKRLLIGFPSSLARMLSGQRDERSRRVYSTAKTLKSVNLECRNFGIDGDDDFRWPEKFFVIGGDRGGNFYCMNLNNKSSKVYFWFHETAEFEPFAKSINHFVEKVFLLEARLAVDKLNYVRL